ncbi:NAD(P)/FAD-dependent oxidoreductase [Limnofasciculus baicalensis]|uniref:FAD-binding oxidoreductase n=1 Tax=Limnofasciculus baicalensis BBK-W-15 TaxID=2699891 RepID=A0AAE3GPU6_9CYAN|nr:FAD-dependent oxidoreductase [Limnofasciculus baicalensis]MCP2728531.1 FAD-binding oxidoreductase [Limnofasciculus baicalensis BBK-W-15]
MTNIVIIGCGIIGAAIAYQLSKIKDLKITVIDTNPPAQGSTGAALGVLMGAISHKVKGRAWQLREASMRRYETLIPELEDITGQKIPFNRQGILMLRFPGEDLASWEKLVQIRKSQGWDLEIWDRDKLQSQCPQLDNDQIIGAIYSPGDRQVNPTILTQALVAAAKNNGVTLKFGINVEGFQSILPNNTNLQICHKINTNEGKLEADWLVIAAGIGSTKLANLLLSSHPNSTESITIKPVLGQALQLQLVSGIGNPDFQPVITGNDVHIVPIGENNYWVGATVEFPNELGEVIAEPILLEKVRQDAIAFCPALASATIVRTWLGKRPRPEGRSAPVIGILPGYSNVLLATGHYRNGVLLAPATAEAIRDVIV